MFTSTAGVFRIRQVASDLTSYVSSDGRNAFRRVVPVKEADRLLDRILFRQCGRMSFPEDEAFHGDILLAAALPDDDFPAFTAATALLLLDRLSGGDGQDDLYWNWDAFADHYRLADPKIRAVLMNGFRAAVEKGAADLAYMPDPADCLSEEPAAITDRLEREGEREVALALQAEPTPEEAAELWVRLAKRTPGPAVMAAARYLYERPQSLAPEDPLAAPIIPWRL